MTPVEQASYEQRRRLGVVGACRHVGVGVAAQEAAPYPLRISPLGIR